MGTAPQHTVKLSGKEGSKQMPKHTTQGSPSLQRAHRVTVHCPIIINATQNPESTKENKVSEHKIVLFCCVCMCVCQRERDGVHMEVSVQSFLLVIRFYLV